MAIHLTPTELGREAGMHRREVITKCMELGVPIFQGGSTRRSSSRASRSSAEAASSPRRSPQPPGSPRPFADSRGRRMEAGTAGATRAKAPERRRSPTCCRGGRSSTPSGRAAPQGRRRVGRRRVRRARRGRQGGRARADRPRHRAGRQRLDPRAHPPRVDLRQPRHPHRRRHVVTIYQTNSPEECQYVLEHSESRAVFVEDGEQLAKIREVEDELPALEYVIVMDPSGRTSATRSRSTRCASAAAGATSPSGRSATRPSRRTTSASTSTPPARPARRRADAHPRQLPRDHRRGRGAGRARRGRLAVPLPAARPRVRDPDPVRGLRPRRDARLLVAGPEEDHPRHRAGEARPTSRRCRACSRRSTRSPPRTSRTRSSSSKAVRSA